MLTNEPQWVAIYTKARAEKKVDEKFGEMGMEHYLPLHKVLRRWSDRKKMVEVPLFSSYTFVRMCKMDKIRVRETPGVAFIVDFGGVEAIVSDKEIDAIKGLIDSEIEMHVAAIQQLKKGAKVRVLGGPLEGYEGVLVSNCKEGNFAVEIQAISSCLLMSIESDLLEVIEEKKKTTKTKTYTIR